MDIPYPSVGDIGYFGSVIFYIMAAYYLASATGLHLTVKDKSKKLIAVIIPIILLSCSYYMFLRGYEFDLSSFSATLTMLLDFGYPLGQAVYIAIALVSYLLSKKMLGGMMRSKILFINFALFVQYIADSSFLYAAAHDKYFTAGANDLMYLIAYVVMSLALLTFVNNTVAAPAARNVDGGNI